MSLSHSFKKNLKKRPKIVVLSVIASIETENQYQVKIAYARASKDKIDLSSVLDMLNKFNGEGKKKVVFQDAYIMTRDTPSVLICHFNENQQYLAIDTICQTEDRRSALLRRNNKIIKNELAELRESNGNDIEEYKIVSDPDKLSETDLIEELVNTANFIKENFPHVKIVDAVPIRDGTKDFRVLHQSGLVNTVEERMNVGFVIGGILSSVEKNDN